MHGLPVVLRSVQSRLPDPSQQQLDEGAEGSPDSVHDDAQRHRHAHRHGDSRCTARRSTRRAHLRAFRFSNFLVPPPLLHTATTSPFPVLIETRSDCLVARSPSGTCRDCRTTNCRSRTESSARRRLDLPSSSTRRRRARTGSGNAKDRTT